MNKTFLFILFLLLYISFVPAQSTKPLFMIERNKNSNRVYYEARIAPDSLFDARQPIHAFWVMWQKDPSGKTREELNLLEKEKGFGFKVKPTMARKSVWFTLVSLPSRPIKASLQNGIAVAECVIDGRFCVVEKVFITVVEKNFIPHVNHIELFGRDAKSGESAYEKVLNR
jgi:hypothetical protein